MRALQPGSTFEHEQLPRPEDGVATYLRAVPLAPRGTEHVELANAFGRVLAVDAIAGHPYPGEDRSTMDGFALRSADGRAPRRIAGTVRMGWPLDGALRPGEAVRIPTGGVLPEGADAVVPLEDADEDGELVTPRETPEAGSYFTRRGDDMRAGDAVLPRGRRIGAAELSVLATLGLAQVEVYLRPRVAVVSTGDELVPANAALGPGQVRDSNRWAIAGGLIALGCDPVHLESARDEVALVAARIAEGLTVADAVVLTGGSSVGARDCVPAAIDTLATPPGVLVHGLKVKPGKPTVLAAVGTTPVIGLPGNPASALTILDAVVAPIFTALSGAREARRTTVATRAAVPFAGRDGWTWYVPAVIGPDGASPLPLRSSHTSLLARADGYVVVGPQPARIEAGQPVTVVRYGAFA